MTTALVIGGGISGLASAALLAKDGYEVTLLEGRPDVGGRAGSLEVDGFRYDTGPSWYLMPEVFDHFFKLMGTSAAEQLDLRRLDPGYRVYFEGEDAPLDISTDRAENLAIFERIETGAGAKLARYLDSARETYEMAKAKFLYTSFQDLRPIMTRDVLSQTGKLAKLLVQPLSTLAARTVSDRRLQQILGYPAVFLGSSPYLTPSMYHLMSHLDLADGVLYPMGGFTRVIEAIAGVARAAGVTIVTDAAVSRIVVRDGRAVGAEYVARGGADVESTPIFVEADIVVSAADLHHTETVLLEPEQQTYPQKYWDSKLAGPGALLLYLGVKGELPQLEHHTLLFTREWEKGFEKIFGATTSVPDPASIYVCKPSAIDPSVAPEGFENLFVLVPVPADPGIGHGGDAHVEALADRVIEQIAAWTGIDDLASRIVVRRTAAPGDFADDLNAWKGTALGPAHTLKQSAFFRAGNVSKKVRGLYYAGGSSIPGIGLPMCLISAEILVKRLRGDTSTGPLPEPLERTVAGAAAIAPTP